MKKNYLIINGNIITGIGEHIIRKEDILIENGIITGVGNKETFLLPNQYDIIDATGKVVCPAFYNLHVHLGETVFRGKCDGMDLWQYLNVSHNMYDEEKWNSKEHDIHRLSGLITIVESMKNGVGYIVCNRGWEEIMQSRMDATCLFPIVNINKLKKYYDNISALKRVKAQYAEHMRTAIFLQSMYLCDEEHLRLIKKIMDEDKELQLFVHIAETVREQNYIKGKYNCTPIEALCSFGLLTDRTFCVHSIYLSDADRKLIKNTNAKIVLCPSSNLKLGDGYPDIEALIEDDISLVVATDGFATNNSASLLEELKVIALQSHGKIASEKLFNMITTNPARYLSGKDCCGLIQEGSKTNISIFSTERYNMLDYDTLMSNFIYNYCDFRCEYVISNGVLVWENGKTTQVDKVQIINEYCELLDELYRNRNEDDCL